MPLIDTSLLKPDERNLLTQQIYNGLDCCVTLEVFEELQTLFNEEPIIYKFERALQGPALEMMLRGFKVDEEQRQKGISRLQSELNQLNETLQDFSLAVWDKPLNPRSSKQLKEFFYGKMRLPEHWSSHKGERKLSMNRETLEKLEVYLYARPIIATILAIREKSKRLEVLETEIDPDGRMRTSYNIAGTETGRWCVDGDTEVLTKSGWQKFKNWQQFEEIAVWHVDRTIKFESCKKIEFDNNETLIRVNNSCFDLIATKDHKIPFFSSKKNFSSALVGEKRLLHSVPVCGLLDATFIPAEQTRVCVMTQADGSIIHPKLIRFHFSKERKIIRCKSLLNDANVEYKSYIGIEGTTYIYVYNPPSWMLTAKYFGPWLLEHNPITVISELHHWDGELDAKSGSTIYYTSSLENAQWIKTVAHLAGHFASLRKKRIANINWAPAYRVHIGVDNSTRITPEHYCKTTHKYKKVYCAETSTGYFLIRKNSQISITGNSSSSNATGTGTNLQNITPELRSIFIADEGWKLCSIDLEQAESREVGWLFGTLFGDWSYLDACEGGDLHTTTCKLIWKDFNWTNDKKKDREIAERPFYRHFSYRDMSKRGGHLTSYFGTAWTGSRHLKIPLRMMEDFQEKFATGDEAAFPAFPKWWRWVAEQLQTERRIITPFGFERFFFGRPNDDTTLREAIAFGPQSATGARTNLWLYRIWKHFGNRVQLLAQVHDNVTFQYRENDNENEIVNGALELLKMPLKAPNGRIFHVPGEAKIGYNWSYEYTEKDAERDLKLNKKPKEINLLGLKKFNSNTKDQRVRT